MVAWRRDGLPSDSLPPPFDSESTTMKTRKLIYLAIFSASTTLSPALLSTGQLPLLAAQADSCQHCPAQLVTPSTPLGQLFL